MKDKKRVTIFLTESELRKVKILAAKDKRSHIGFIENLVLTEIKKENDTNNKN